MCRPRNTKHRYKIVTSRRAAPPRTSAVYRHLVSRDTTPAIERRRPPDAPGDIIDKHRTESVHFFRLTLFSVYGGVTVEGPIEPRRRTLRARSVACPRRPARSFQRSDNELRLDHHPRDASYFVMQRFVDRGRARWERLNRRRQCAKWARQYPRMLPRIGSPRRIGSPSARVPYAQTGVDDGSRRAVIDSAEPLTTRGRAIGLHSPLRRRCCCSRKTVSSAANCASRSSISFVAIRQRAVV